MGSANAALSDYPGTIHQQLLPAGSDRQLLELLQLLVAQRLGEHELGRVLPARQQRPRLRIRFVGEEVEDERRLEVERHGDEALRRIHIAHTVKPGDDQRAVIVQIQDVRAPMAVATAGDRVPGNRMTITRRDNQELVALIDERVHGRRVHLPTPVRQEDPVRHLLQQL